MYQNSLIGPTPPRTNAGRLRDEIARVARALIFSVPNLSDRDKDLLYNVAGGCHGFATLERLVSIAARSTQPEHREALAESVRGWSLSGVAPVIDVQIALDLETAAQGPADIAAREFEKHPTRVTREVAIERHTAHLFGLRAVLDSLHVHRCL